MGRNEIVGRKWKQQIQVEFLRHSFLILRNCAEVREITVYIGCVFFVLLALGKIEHI